jgi:hypothetical protein
MNAITREYIVFITVVLRWFVKLSVSGDGKIQLSTRNLDVNEYDRCNRKYKMCFRKMDTVGS